MKLIKTLVLLCFLIFVLPSQANLSAHFDQIKKDPKQLYDFFKLMPKGGELHYHLAGGPSPEAMLSLASKGPYCLETKTLSIQKSNQTCQDIAAKDLNKEPKLYNQIIKTWSMQDFIPDKESGHDHFFKGFDKYLPLVFDHRPELIAWILQKAAQQQEQYLELLSIPDNAESAQFGSLVTELPSLDQKRQRLLINPKFQHNIRHTLEESERFLKEAKQHLGCAQSQTAACAIEVKLLYYALREQPLDSFFAQTLNAFEAVSRSNKYLVGVNLVAAEDGPISLKDYHQQMLIFNYFHKRYPQVPIALHAGELTADLVSLKDLSFHIREAVLKGHAQRIGHGVDIQYEEKAEQTLAYMAKHQIPVEINLISNLKILNILGQKHPLHLYLRHQVPVVLSTDDEGVLRTDLTQQYVQAVLDQGLDYPSLKQINRNTLTYAFLPGKSLWADSGRGILVPDCQDLNAASCLNFLRFNEKGQQQWNLEQRLIAFEKKFN